MLLFQRQLGGEMIEPDDKETLGDCYEAAGRYLLFRMTSGEEDPGMVLVHGEVSGQGDLKGRRFGHAWVEITSSTGTVVLELSNGREEFYSKALYYKIGEISESNCSRYPPTEFAVALLKNLHWGPWDPLPPGRSPTSSLLIPQES